MTDPSCPRCQWSLRHAKQVYSVEGELGTYLFDVDRAKRLVSARARPTAIVPPDMLKQMLEVNDEHHEAHVDHVDPSIPGILGQRLGGIALIDGSHRARRCLRDGITFHAYMLDLKESTDCMMLSEQIDFTPELMAREIRGMLRNNQQCEMLTTELALTEGEDPAATEAALRSHLTPEENARWTISFAKLVDGY